MEKRNLPWDLIEEILSKVPAKSTARFRSTAKQWNDLLKSERFAKKHLANAPKEESLSVLLIYYRVCLVRINLHGCHNNVAPSAKVAYEFNLKDPLSNSSQVDIVNVFHCDGLLLCTTRDKRLVVWNPCSGETKWVKPRDSYRETDNYALGYDKRSSCKQYKILRMGHQRFYSRFFTEYEIFGFTSDSWRVLGMTTKWGLKSPHAGGMSMKGNTYWVGTDITLEAEPRPLFLLSFDFSTERFLRVSLPHLFHCCYAALSVVREKQLFLLGTSRDAYSRDFLHVWVTTSTSGSVMSWSKILTFKANPEISTYDFYSGLSFLAYEQNKALVYCYNYSNHNKILHVVGGNKHIQVDPRDVNSTIRPSSHPLLLNYVTSLAQIQQGTHFLGDAKEKSKACDL